MSILSAYRYRGIFSGNKGAFSEVQGYPLRYRVILSGTEALS